MSNYDSLFENIRLSLIRIGELHPEIWERISERSPEAKKDWVVDSYKEWNRRNLIYHLKLCNLMLEYSEDVFITKLRQQCADNWEKINVQYPIPEMTISEIVDKINTAFFKLERYMEGKTDLYQFFGFNDAFTILFDSMSNTENERIENFEKISFYWKLCNQIAYDYDKSDFENSNAFQNSDFCRDCEEINYLRWDRVDEFSEYGIDEEEPDKISIRDKPRSQIILPNKTNNLELENLCINIKNNFDKTPIKIVFEHFFNGLVEPGYLTLEELERFVIKAFEKKVAPKPLIKLINAPKKNQIEKVFYKYYKEVAGKVHGTQIQYAGLLGEYFEGYKTKNVSTNFSKSIY